MLDLQHTLSEDRSNTYMERILLNVFNPLGQISRYNIMQEGLGREHPVCSKVQSTIELDLKQSDERCVGVGAEHSHRVLIT